jgi:23S rRNA pseudouridine2605 synthase
VSPPDRGGRPSPGEGERLQKALAHAGVASRRAVEDMIRAGRVRVDGRTAVLGQRIDPTKAKVEVDGSIVPLAPGLVHYLLNKPVGVVTTADDAHGRPTVLEIVDLDVRVWPVGRLDMDSEGALILTNDGELTQRLTHPSFGVPKTYLAEVEGIPARAAVRRLERGVELDDGPAAALRAHTVSRHDRTTLVEVTLGEGRRRQVRRMFDAIGHPVVALVRVSIGPVALGRLKPGTFRRLSPEEVRSLYGASTEGKETDRHVDKSAPHGRRTSGVQAPKPRKR